jgi:hypothetical protein
MTDTRKTKLRPQYSVVPMHYASIEDKEKLLAGELPAFQASVVYIGPSERIALYHFGRACISQSGDALAYSVTLKRAGETITEVKPVPPL